MLPLPCHTHYTAYQISKFEAMGSCADVVACVLLTEYGLTSGGLMITLCLLPPFTQFTSSRIMILAKETEREKDIPKARESVYLLLDLVRMMYTMIATRT